MTSDLSSIASTAYHSANALSFNGDDVSRAGRPSSQSSQNDSKISAIGDAQEGVTFAKVKEYGANTMRAAHDGMKSIGSSINFKEMSTINRWTLAGATAGSTIGIFAGGPAGAGAGAMIGGVVGRAAGYIHQSISDMRAEHKGEAFNSKNLATRTFEVIKNIASYVGKDISEGATSAYKCLRETPGKAIGYGALGVIGFSALVSLSVLTPFIGIASFGGTLLGGAAKVVDWIDMASNKQPDAEEDNGEISAHQSQNSQNLVSDAVPNEVIVELTDDKSELSTASSRPHSAPEANRENPFADALSNPKAPSPSV